MTVFPPDTQVVISVQIFPDNLLEGEERFSVFITSSDEHTNMTLSTTQITIVDSSEGREHNDIVLYCGVKKEGLGSPHSMNILSCIQGSNNGFCFLVNVEFGSSDYSVQESADHVEVCLTLDGMAQFPISFHISAGEASPRDAEGQNHG